MSKVFFHVAMSLDGYIAPEGMELEHAHDPSYKDWLKWWSELQNWQFEQKFFRENLKLGEGGQTGVDNQLLERVFHRTGANIMGKRMFDGGEHHWPEDAPFHTPVFVVTHQVRDPWERLGGTTFFFVNDGIESALSQAREAAGDKDIRIAGGASTILQYLNAGLVDEFILTVPPLLLGGGVPLFKGIERDKIALKIVDVIHSPLATHLTYAVGKR